MLEDHERLFKDWKTNEKAFWFLCHQLVSSACDNEKHLKNHLNNEIPAGKMALLTEDVISVIALKDKGL